MSVTLMAAVWKVQLPDSEKLVLLALADCANDEGACWPSMKTLTEKCSKSDRTIQAAIKDLVSKGHLTRIERPGKGCLYRVHPSTPEAASPPVTPEAISPRSDFAPKRTTSTPEAASDKPSRTIKTRGKEVRASEKPHRFPADWQPSAFPESVQALVDLWPPGRLDREIEQFRDYWLDRTDKRPGWDRTFHNRIRDIHDRVMRENRDAGSQQHRGAPTKPALVDIGRQVAAKFEARAAAAAAGGRG
jgi:hypothetical protein